MDQFRDDVALLKEARVLDRDGGLGGQGHQGIDVVLGEGRVILFVERFQRADDLGMGAHRHGQQIARRRFGRFLDVLEPARIVARIRHQYELAMRHDPARQAAFLGDDQRVPCSGADVGRRLEAQLLRLGIDKQDRSRFRVRQLHRRLDDLFEQGTEVQGRGQLAADFHQTLVTRDPLKRGLGCGRGLTARGEQIVSMHRPKPPLSLRQQSAAGHSPRYHETGHPPACQHGSARS